MEYEFEHACSMNVFAWMQREESISPRCSGMRTIEKEEILFAKVSRASFLAQNFKKLYKTIAPLRGGGRKVEKFHVILNNNGHHITPTHPHETTTTNLFTKVQPSGAGQLRKESLTRNKK